MRWISIFSLILLSPLLVAATGCNSERTPLGVLRPAYAAPAAAEEPGRCVDFGTDYREALALAGKSNKPLMVFFSASQCVYCNQMIDETFCDPRIAVLASDFECVQIVADRAPEVCRDFRIEVFPTVQFVSVQGTPLHRLTGKQDAEALAARMEAALHGPHIRTAYRGNLPTR